MKLIASERRNRLMEMINSQGNVQVKEAATLLNVTSETIRNDLKYLSDQGLLQKKYGGAVSIGRTDLTEEPLELRSKENQEIKQKIALKAAELCKDQMVIFIDSGSTMLALSKILAIGDAGLSRENTAIVTNSFSNVEILCRKFSHVYFLGGEVNQYSMSTTGLWANYALSSLKLDIAFMGTNGFQSHSGPCVKTFADAELKKHIIKSCSYKVVLTDHTKFQTNAIMQYAQWNEIDLLITDSLAPADARKRIEEETSVIVV